MEQSQPVPNIRPFQGGFFLPTLLFYLMDTFFLAYSNGRRGSRHHSCRKAWKGKGNLGFSVDFSEDV